MGGMRIAITGASGLIGTALGAVVRAGAWEGGGHTLLPLVRRSAMPAEVAWDPVAGTVDTDALEGVDAVVHLAGESVAGGRWTVAGRERILRSRMDGTRTIAKAFAGLRRKPAVLVSASARDTLCRRPAPGGSGEPVPTCSALGATGLPKGATPPEDSTTITTPASAPRRSACPRSSASPAPPPCPPATRDAPPPTPSARPRSPARPGSPPRW